MPRYIDAEKIDTRERGNNSQRTMWHTIKEIVDGAPTADVQEVKHGHWTQHDCGNPFLTYWECYSCHYKQGMSSKLKYCPDCGARMDGDDSEQSNV